LAPAVLPLGAAPADEDTGPVVDVIEELGGETDIAEGLFEEREEVSPGDVGHFLSRLTVSPVGDLLEDRSQLEIVIQECLHFDDAEKPFHFCQFLKSVSTASL